MTKRIFGKDYKTPRELVTLLENRGLIINDRQKAQLYLESIGYYRLSAYMHPLLKTPKILHLYKEGATFNKVMMLYRFDKKLRLLLFNEIEKIEIAVREAVMNMTAERTGDIYWLTNSAHFRDQSIFVNSMAMLSKEYERSTEDFIEHFKRTYTEPFPPAWILGELLPMGSVNLGFAVKKSGNYSISASRMDQPMLLQDNQTGATYDLTDGDYQFAADAGTYNSRFVLVPTRGTTGIADIINKTGVNIMPTEQGINFGGLNGKTVIYSKKLTSLQNIAGL